MSLISTSSHKKERQHISRDNQVIVENICQPLFYFIDTSEKKMGHDKNFLKNHEREDGLRDNFLAENQRTYLGCQKTKHLGRTRQRGYLLFHLIIIRLKENQKFQVLATVFSNMFASRVELTCTVISTSNCENETFLTHSFNQFC